MTSSNHFVHQALGFLCLHAFLVNLEVQKNQVLLSDPTHQHCTMLVHPEDRKNQNKREKS